MKALVDLFPVVIFFVTYKVYGFYVATAALIAATCVQVGYNWFKHRRLEKMHLVVLILVILFGGATLYLKDPLFVKWKTSIVEWLFALAFLGSQFIGSKPFIQRMMGAVIIAPREIWIRLNIAWVLFFTAMGFVNLYVAYNYEEDTWVNFKLFGMTGMTVVFVLIQAFFLARYVQTDDEKTADGDL